MAADLGKDVITAKDHSSELDLGGVFVLTGVCFAW